MVLKPFITVLAVVLCLSASPLVVAGDSSLVGSLEAFRVVLTEEGKESFLPADKAQPNDVIEYRLTYTNSGKEPVNNVLITDPIPWGTKYVESSATGMDLGHVKFSIDKGKSFHAWPISIKKKTEQGVELEEEATPDMVTHVRWVIAGSFEPDKKITLTYRTSIK